MAETRAFEVRVHDAGTIVPDVDTTADNLSDTSASAHGFVSQAHTVADDSLDDAVSVYFEKKGADHIAMVALEYTGGTTELTYEAEINLNGGETDTSNSPDAPTRVVVEDWGDFWRVSVVGANNSTGNTTATALAYPHVGTTLGTRDVSVTGDADVWGVQLEDGPFPSSYIATTSSAVTRAADNVSEDHTASPQEMTGYIKLVERGSALSNLRVVEIGDRTQGAGVEVHGSLSGDRYFYVHDNGPDNDSVFLAPEHALGDVVELRFVLESDGAMTFERSVNGGALETATSPGVSLAGSWGDTIVSINSTSAGARTGFNDFIALTISSGVQTMDEMRSLADSKAGDLYSYYPGDPVDTFSRASAASYRNENEALKTATSGTIRDRHHVTDEDAKQAGATRLEASRANNLTQSEDFSHADWTKSNVTVTADAAASPDDTSVDFTIPDSRLVAPPDFGGRVIRPLEGKADLLPYSVTVVDDDGWLTSRIFEGGVPIVIGRLAEVVVSRNGGAFETVDIRRISSVRGGTTPEYQIELSEERWVGRGDVLFESNDTLQLVPQMPAADWFTLTGGERTDPLDATEPGLVRAVAGEFVLIQSGGPRIDPEIQRAGLEEDVIDNPAPSNTDGNFETLEFEDQNGFRHPVVSFSSLDAASKEDVLGLDWKVAPEDTNPIMPDFWVYWPLHGFAVNDNVGPWRLLWPDGLPTTETTPYLVGKPQGTDYPIGEFLRDIYEGVYGGDSLRFHQPSLDALRDLGGADGNWWIVTGPVDREAFLAELYRSHLIAPITAADGSIAPVQIVPESITGSEAFTVDATNATSGVSYENTGRDLANAFRLTRLQARSVSRAFGTPLRSVAVSPKGPPLQEYAGIHDRRSTYRLEREQVMTTSQVGDVLDNLLDPLFDLVGDGAQVGTVNLVPRSDGRPEVGESIIVDLDSLKGPNPGSATRSGLRAAVVLERKRTWRSGETSVEVRFWDLGTTLNNPISHGDAEAHVDSHSDDTHLDEAHSDVTHGDSSHADTHTDDPHEDVAHADHSDTIHTDHDDVEVGEHFDHDDTTHNDSHTDVSHADDHSDSAHSDSAHEDSEHGDDSHADDHGDDTHLDNPHGDLPHADGHDDLPHGDGHSDTSSHGDSPHDDQPHEDHDDAHNDVHADHDDSPGGHVDGHADHDDATGNHEDTAHTDADHSDTIDHGDLAHSDYPESSGHDDVSHSDDAHDDGHTDVPHNDLAA